MSGITNPGGNICYSTSAIQLLCSSVLIRDDFIKHKQNHELEKRAKGSACNTCLVATVIEYVKEGHNRAFPGGKLQPLLKEYSGCRQDARDFIFNFININFPEIRDHMALTYRKYSMCPKCETYSEMKPETEIMITINSSCDSIQEGLNRYFGDELIDDCICDICGNKATLLTEKVVQENPPVLAIHNLDGHHLLVNNTVKIFKETFYLLGYILIEGFTDETRHYMTVRRVGREFKLFDDNKIYDYDYNESVRNAAYIALYHTFTEQPDASSAASQPVFPGPQDVRPTSKVGKPKASSAFGSEASMKAAQSHEELIRKPKMPTEKEDEEVDNARKSESAVTPKKSKDSGTSLGRSDSEAAETAETSGKSQDTTDVSHTSKTVEKSVETSKEEDQQPSQVSAELSQQSKGEAKSTESSQDDQEQPFQKSVDSTEQQESAVSSSDTSARTSHITYITHTDEKTGFQYFSLMDEHGNITELDIDPRKSGEAIEATAKDISKRPRPVGIDDESERVPSKISRFAKSPKDVEIFVKGSPFKIKMLYIPIGKDNIERYCRNQKKDFNKFRVEQLMYIDKNRGRIEQDIVDRESEIDSTHHTIPDNPTENDKRKASQEDVDLEDAEELDDDQDEDYEFKPTIDDDEDEETTNVLKIRKRKRKRAKATVQSHQKVPKRRYDFFNWKAPKGGARGARHKSFYYRDKPLRLSDEQKSSHFCLLCGGKKKFFNRKIDKMSQHYKTKHCRRVMRAGPYYLLLCKCSDVQSHQDNTDRNAHHHCAYCWKPEPKGEKLLKHMITTCNLKEDEIQLDVKIRKDPPSPKKEEEGEQEGEQEGEEEGEQEGEEEGEDADEQEGLDEGEDEAEN